MSLFKTSALGGTLKQKSALEAFSCSVDLCVGVMKFEVSFVERNKKHTCETCYNFVQGSPLPSVNIDVICVINGTWPSPSISAGDQTMVGHCSSVVRTLAAQTRSPGFKTADFS